MSMSTPIYDELCQMMPCPSGSSEEAVAAPRNEVAGVTDANGQVSSGATDGQSGHHAGTADRGPAEGADSQVDGKANGTVK